MSGPTSFIAAEPYPWPFDGRLDPRRLALVVAGDQLAWAGRSWHAGEVAVVIDAVASAVRACAGLVVHVRHGLASDRRSRHALPPASGESGWALATPTEAGDVVVDAAGIDGFYGSALDRQLRALGVDTLVLAGYGAEAAVSSTLRSANDQGYECLTLVDAVAPFDTFTGKHLFSSITMSGGIFGAIAPSDALVASLRSLTVLTPAEA